MTNKYLFMKLITILLAASVFLVACGNDKEKIYDKQLIFLEKTTQYENPSLIFESKEDKTYYSVKVDNYTYDNIEFKENEEFQFEGKKDIRKSLIEYNTKESIFIFDEWKPLYPLTTYTKDD